MNKNVLKGISLVVILTSIYLFWGNIKSNIYEEGYNDAVVEYQNKIAEANTKHIEDIQKKLKELRSNLSEQHKKEFKRFKEQQSITSKTNEVIRYIDREIYVKEECNTVDPDIIRLFNESISRVNSSKEG